MVVALPIFGAFVLGLGSRRWLQRHFALLFRVQFALGMGLLAVLSGWSFDLTLRNVTALGVLLVAHRARAERRPGAGAAAGGDRARRLMREPTATAAG